MTLMRSLYPLNLFPMLADSHEASRLFIVFALACAALPIHVNLSTLFNLPSWHCSWSDPPVATVQSSEQEHLPVLAGVSSASAPSQRRL